MEYTKQEVENYKKAYKQYIDKRNSDWKSIPYNEFLTIVKNVKLDLIKHKPSLAKCHYCNGGLTNLGGSSTCLGSSGPYDVNHHWVYYKCKDCGKKNTLEFKGEANGYNYWITGEDNKLLLGIPTCFESYKYTCNKCDGDVIRENIDLKSNKPTSIISIVFATNTKNCKTIYRCTNCDNSIESSTEYYQSYNPHEPRKPWRSKPKKLKLGWIMYEEVGMGTANFGL